MWEENRMITNFAAVMSLSILVLALLTLIGILVQLLDQLQRSRDLAIVGGGQLTPAQAWEKLRKQTQDRNWALLQGGSKHG
jgi:hypothetical protein